MHFTARWRCHTTYSRQHIEKDDIVSAWISGLKFKWLHGHDTTQPIFTQTFGTVHSFTHIRRNENTQQARKRTCVQVADALTQRVGPPQRKPAPAEAQRARARAQDHDEWPMDYFGESTRGEILPNPAFLGRGLELSVRDSDGARPGLEAQ